MTYIQESLHKGRISRWDRADFPLPFFMEKCRWYAAKGEEYKYNDMVLRALKEWEARSNGLVSFRPVGNLFDSKVNLTWKRVDRKSLGLCKFEYNQNRMFTAEVEIGLSDGIIHRQYMDDNEVYHTILHELGHSIGLGHSTDKKDIMYTPHQYGIVHISDNDIKTLEYMYNLPIGLSGKQMGEQFKIGSENFDEIINILEDRYLKENNIQTQGGQQAQPTENRNLSEENRRLADLKKYTMTLQNINVNVDPLINKGDIYKKNSKRWIP